MNNKTYEEFDVVVVGGGHNGLVAACYLARAGHRVALVEAAPELGGLTTSGALIPNAPCHIVHPAGLDFMLFRKTTIYQDLQLSRHGLRLIDADPPYGYLHPTGESIMFWRDPARTASDIAHFSPDDAKAYLEFMEVLDGLLDVAIPMMLADPVRPSLSQCIQALRGTFRQRKQLGKMLAFATEPAEAVAQEYFTHPATISAMVGIAAGMTAPDAEGSGLALIFPGVLHRIGSGRAEGGIQNFINALERALREAGGTVITGSPVEEILVEKGRATGVRLQGGRGLKSRAVLTSCDPRTTLLKLLPEDALDRRTRIRASYIPSNAAGVDVMKIDMALSGRIRFPHHQRKDGLDLRLPLVLYGTTEDTRASFDASRRGELPKNPLLWVATPTGFDPTQAPDAQDSVYLYPAAVPRNPAGGWPENKDEMTRLTLAKANQFIEGLESQEIGRRVETPLERSERTRTTNGTLLHVDFNLLRSGPLRPALGLGGYKTPVEGLFLGGSGSHPNGSITGIPGQLSSRRVDRFLKQSG